MSDKATHHCDFCSKDIVPEYDEDSFGVTTVARCSCGASSNDYQHEFGIDEPWVKPIPRSASPLPAAS